MSDPKKRLFFPLSVKLTVPVVFIVGVVALGVYLGLMRQMRTTLFQSKEVAAEMVVKLNALAVMPAVVFGDATEMERSVGDLAKNPEVLDVELWPIPAPKEGPDQPLAQFHRSGDSKLGRPSGAASSRRVDGGSVFLVEPIVNPTAETIGVISVRFSTARELSVLSLLSKQVTTVAGGVALGLTLAILLIIARVIISPLRKLERAAQRMEQGDLSAAASVARHASTEDEVDRLAHAFQQMANAVADREEKLAVRNEELKLILNSVDQGFLTANLDGTLRQERSAIVDRWVGELPAGATFADLVSALNPSVGDWTGLAWEQLSDGMMPFDISLDQLPKRASTGERHFAFDYHPIANGDELQRVVIVISDITAELERQRAVEEQHEFATLVDKFVRDRKAFLEFWEEAAELVQRIRAGSATGSLKRDIHTLKGNSRFFGLSRLSALCHSLEDAMAEVERETLDDAEVERLQLAWLQLEQRISPLTRTTKAFLELTEKQYHDLVTVVKSGTPAAISNAVEQLRYEYTERHLLRARDVIDAACQKVGKTIAHTHIQHGNLKVDPEQEWNKLWNVLVHILNNAVDHGLENDEERIACGKELPGNISLESVIDQGDLVFTIADDGRGIDWDAVRSSAKRRGLPHATQADLEAALFAEGVTAKLEVTDVSGRGVGMSAVLEEVQKRSGRIEVTSERGRGTTWRIRFPRTKTKVLQAEPPPRRTAPPTSMPPKPH